jgi:uncharacterized OB-fold protein
MQSYSREGKIMPECNEIYWDKLKEGSVFLQQCSHCNKFIFYPRSICPDCLESDLDWKPVCGKGRVYSYTVVYVSALPGFVSETPYIYAIIELEEEIRMPGTIIDCPIGEVRVNMPVEFVIIEKDGHKLPVFRRIKE